MRHQSHSRYGGAFHSGRSSPSAPFQPTTDHSSFSATGATIVSTESLFRPKPTRKHRRKPSNSRIGEIASSITVPASSTTPPRTRKPSQASEVDSHTSQPKSAISTASRSAISHFEERPAAPIPRVSPDTTLTLASVFSDEPDYSRCHRPLLTTPRISRPISRDETMDMGVGISPRAPPSLDESTASSVTRSVSTRSAFQQVTPPSLRSLAVLAQHMSIEYNEELGIHDIQRMMDESPAIRKVVAFKLKQLHLV